MNKTARNIGLVALSIAALAIPVAIIARNMMRKRRAEADAESEDGHTTTIFPAYRGKHKPHHRKAGNGSLGSNLS